MKDSLKAATRDHYATWRLSDAEIDKINSRVAALATAQRQRRRLYWLAACCSVLLAVWILAWRAPSEEQQIMAIAREIASEHLAQAQLEILSGEFAAIQQHFQKLNFRPQIPRAFSQDQLIGARYCSIASIPAAQLRYQTNRHAATVYQVRFEPQTLTFVDRLQSRETPLVRDVNGVRVRLWVENSLFMAAAQRLAD